MGRSIQPFYCKAIIIAHGQSEDEIVKKIKSMLRLQIEIYGATKNRSSIELGGLRNVLSNTIFKDFNSFIKRFPNVETINNDIVNCKIFIIMDMDDCINEGRPENADRFKNKEMFENHWLYEHIVPIYNDPDVEAMVNIIDPNVRHNLDDIKRFLKKIKSPNAVEFWNDFSNRIRPKRCTNFEIFIDYCVNWAVEKAKSNH